MRVLAIGAHPDDVEILCAGTIAHYADQGADVTVAVLTDGRLGASSVDASESVTAIRCLEAKCAVNVIGADLIWIGCEDGFLYDDARTRTLVVDLLRRARPDLIFTHHPHDYHPDHRAAAQLVAAARLLAREAALSTPHNATSKVSPLIFMDTLMAEGAPSPDFWIDITETIGQKHTMLAKHISQNTARYQRRGSDLVDLMQAQATLRGRQAQVRYAEAFYFASSHPASTITDLMAEANSITLPIISTDHAAANCDCGNF